MSDSAMISADVQPDSPSADSPSADSHDRALDRLIAGRPDQAEAGCRRVLAADDGDFRAHVVLAATLAALGRKPEGKAAWERAAALTGPDTARAELFDVALRLHHASKPLLAQPVYELVNEIWPNRPELHHPYAILLHQRGNNDAALSLLGRLEGMGNPLPAANRALIEAFVRGESRGRLPIIKPDPTPRGSRRLFIVDPGCVNDAGHHFALNRACEETGRARGVPCHSLIHLSAPVPVQTRLNGAAVLRCPVYFETGDPNSTLTYFAQNGTMRDDLNTHMRMAFTAEDVVLFHTVTNAHLLGMLDWYRGLTGPRPKLRIVLRFPPDTMVHPIHRPLSEFLYAHALRLWRDAGFEAGCEAGREKVRFFADHARMARHFSDLSGVPVESCVVPIDFPPDVDTGPAERADPPTVVFLGNALGVKGFDLLPGVVSRVRAAIPDARFILQTLHADRGTLNRLAAAAAPGAVLAVTRPLHGAEYHNLIGLADLVWAVYDPATYHHRTSHTAVEALGFGRPVIITADTTMALDVAEMGGRGAIVSAGFDEESAAAGVIAGLTDRVALGRQARDGAAAWRARHGFARFFDRMMAD